MIICAKAIKTIYAAAEQIQDEIPELTGIYYIPASLNEEGFLSFAAAEKKLPWFPREYLLPMVEPKLAIGDADAVDRFISGHVDRIEKIKSWSDYVRFFREYYEAVAESSFMEKTVRNMEGNEPEFELEENMYIFLDNTVYSTFHIMNLYNHLQVDNQPKALYDNFLSIQETEIKPLPPMM